MIKETFFTMLYNALQKGDYSGSETPISLSETDAGSAVFRDLDSKTELHLYVDEQKRELIIRLFETFSVDDSVVIGYSEGSSNLDIYELTASSLGRAIKEALSEIRGIYSGESDILFYFVGEAENLRLQCIQRNNTVSENTVALIGTMLTLRWRQSIEFSPNLHIGDDYPQAVTPGFKCVVGDVTDYFYTIGDTNIAIVRVRRNIYDIGYPNINNIQNLTDQISEDLSTKHSVWDYPETDMIFEIKRLSQGTDLVGLLKEMTVLDFTDDRLLLRGTSKIEFKCLLLDFEEYATQIQYRLNDSPFWHSVDRDGVFAINILNMIHQENEVLSMMKEFSFGNSSSTFNFVIEGK